MNALSRQVDDREYLHIASGIWLAVVNSNDSDMRRFALHWRCHAAVEGEPASGAAERTRRAYSAMMKHGTGGPRFDQLRRNYQIALSEARAAELREADIVFTTCVSCRRMAVAQALAEEGAPVFWQVIVDEAGQATEPEALCPLTFAKSAQQICLFGDHQQLRPILKSQLTEGAGLAISLFERLVLQGMNPGISWFPSHQFYGGRLLDDVFVQEQPPGLLEHPAQAQRSVPMFAWEVDAVGAASGERVSHTRTVDNSAGSRMHAGEAQSAARLAEQLAKIAGPASVGILCWYRAQVAAISEELCCPGIHVGSVATAQGSEWDYVLLSTVRRGGAAVKGRLGIVADPHILNVALTRARRGLVVLGHEATLSQDPNWKAFFDHCRQTDVQIQGPPLISTQPEVLEESFARALVPGVKVEIQGLQSSPELNGKTGTIMTLANERGRWEVEVKKGSDARRLALKLANLSLVQVTKEPAEGSPQSKSLSGLKAIVTSDRPVDGVEFSKTWQVPTDRLRPKTKLALGEEVRIQGAAEGFEGALRSRGPDRSGCWTVEVSKHFCMQQGPVDVKVVKKGLEVSASGGMAHLLQQGKVVMLHGLKSQPKLNAEWGVVTSL
ncbi:Helz2, partial [Symbiodinium sp. KB8]